MSGLGEALAITGCVFGLIQAYDAASRSIERIQKRRRAHRALPPTERLQNAVEQGKNEIQAMVAHGRERFGSEFEKGDSMYWSRFRGGKVTEIEQKLSKSRSCKLQLPHNKPC
jgi:hypothetical protein